MTTLFISDVHLDDRRPRTTAQLQSFLQREAVSADALYILGDLFEYWLGDDVLSACATAVAETLARLNEQGVPCYFMHGNRDFLLKQGYADTAGLTLLPEEHVADLYGEPVLLMHGDSLCTRDEAYMAFRRQARDPQWQAQILGMPITERIDLARQLREQSGEANSNKAEDIMDVTPEEVVKALQEHNVTTLIHGHTHRPAVHDLEIEGAPARRLVLGDWQPDQGWEIVVEATGAPELRAFPL